ncbi:MAG: hypothetical protein S4CHLAM6_01870 [Chlamydiae bacterium]|nr:hypothetical protein [Chlamydiota bacterium]
MTLLVSNTSYYSDRLFSKQPQSEKLFYFRSTLEKLKTPQNDALTEQELDKFLSCLLDDSLLDQISSNELNSAKKLLVNYARKGTEGFQDKATLENDITDLFHEENSLKQSSSKFSKNFEFCLKKKGKTKKALKKLGKFFKKHRKAIVIGVIVVAAVAVAAIAVVAATNAAGSAAIAQSLAASGAATGGLIGTEKKEDSETPEDSKIVDISQSAINSDKAASNTELAAADGYLDQYNIEQFHTEAYQAISGELPPNTNQIQASNSSNGGNLRPSNIKDILPKPQLNYDELLAQMPLELYGDGMSHRKKPMFFTPAQVVSCGAKECLHGKTMFMAGMATELDTATKYAQTISDIQGGNKVDLIYDPTLGRRKDLLKVWQIQSGCEFPAGALFKKEIINYFENAKPNQVLHVNVHSRGGAILKQILPDIPKEYRDRMYVDTFGTAGFIGREMAKRVKNFWHEDDFTSKIADKKGWLKAKEEGTLITIPSEGLTGKEGHAFFGGYKKPIEEGNIRFAKGDLK